MLDSLIIMQGPSALQLRRFFCYTFEFKDFLRLGMFRANSLDISLVDVMLNGSYLDLENAKQGKIR
jgi:hypothetical protein